MPPGQIILYVVIALAAGVILWLFARPKALPPSEEPKALEPEPEPKPEPEPADQDETSGDGDEAQDAATVDADQDGADQADADPDVDQADADQADADPADAAEDDAEADAEADEAVADSSEPADSAEDEPDEASDDDDDASSETSSPFAASSSTSGPIPRFAPPKFAPPPSVGKKKKQAPKPKPKAEAPKPEPKAEAPKPEPKADPQAQAPRPEPVPMPVDKPKVPTREEREQAELDAKKTERDRYRLGLRKTKRGFISRLARLFRGKPKVSDDLKDDIEEVLFTADIGAKTAEALLESVTKELDKKEVADPDAVWTVIREKGLELLDIDAQPLDYEPSVRPYTLLMIGVNGVGKTTTLGKLAARHVEAGRKTLLVAGDTYRAAAGEQLEVWARRVGCDIHLGKDGADPSSVIFDGIMRGREENYDIVLCDTAGRLHTRKELMDELGKMGRAATKALSKGRDEVEPHDIFLVLDATIGQNALAQAQMFKETMAFSGLVLTKLDGTAKGGVVIGVVDELGIPVRYIGIGEAVDDLRRFDPEAFCDVLFKPDEDDADEDD